MRSKEDALRGKRFESKRSWASACVCGFPHDKRDSRAAISKTRECCCDQLCRLYKVYRFGKKVHEINFLSFEHTLFDTFTGAGYNTGAADIYVDHKALSPLYFLISHTKLLR